MPKPIPATRVLTPKIPVNVDWEKTVVPPTAIVCPYCNSKSHFTPVVRTGRRERAWIIQKCDNCSELVFTKYRVESFVGRIPFPFKLDKDPETVYPYAHPVTDPSIPEEVAHDYIEAFTCYSAEAFNASVVMSRRAIQTAAIMKGATRDKKLWEQIEELADKGLEKSLIDLATEIRLLGNVPASHPSEEDLTRSVQSEECKQILDFLEAFIDSVFIRPAKIERMKEARETSKKETEKEVASKS
nr:DUF4145 domain-containing protein [Candidatus Njordarchaeota archaeon]